MIAIIDYGMGNLRSVQKAFEVCGARAKVTSSPSDLEKAEKLIFPGVGAFGAAMKELGRLKLVQPIKDAIDGGKYFLGLCLGMQLLFEKSEEAPGVKGLCVLKGDVRRFNFTQYGLKIPHMGWNVVSFQLSAVSFQQKILKGVPNKAYAYFVHSYYVEPKDRSIAITTTDYGVEFVSGIRKDNIYGFQFHPEKSQNIGLKIVSNFARLRT